MKSLMAIATLLATSPTLASPFIYECAPELTGGSTQLFEISIDYAKSRASLKLDGKAVPGCVNVPAVGDEDSSRGMGIRCKGRRKYLRFTRAGDEVILDVSALGKKLPDGREIVDSRYMCSSKR